MLLDKDVLKASTYKGIETYERISTPVVPFQDGTAYHTDLLGALRAADARVYDLIHQEYDRLQDSLQLIAAENRCSRAVLAALGSVMQDKTTEGFAGARFHGGCAVVDQVETLAIERAKQAFGAQYANVQPHSGTAANQIVMTAILDRDSLILAQGLDQGGHVSHGGPLSLARKFFRSEHYRMDPSTLRLNYDAIRRQALEVRPNLIICGASAYSRTIDFERFREIADEVGAFLLADISHVAGLVIAGAHPSPVDCAHFTTTSTYKPGGPRGGLILMGRDFDGPITVGTRTRPLWEHLDKTTFPGVQGTPYLNHIAAKAVFFRETLSADYKSLQWKIIENAKALASALGNLGFEVITGGTDNHMVLINVAMYREGLTGVIAQRALEDCGMIVNMNRLPYDPRPQAVTSGIRLGTPILTKNGMTPGHMRPIARMLQEVLDHVRPVSDRTYDLDGSFKAHVRGWVRDLCRRFPLR